MTPRRHGIGGFAGLFAVALPLAPALGDTPRVFLVPELNGVLAEVTADTATFIACMRTGSQSAAAAAADWKKSRALIIATLWATDFPKVYIDEVEGRITLPDMSDKPPGDDACIAVEDRLTATLDSSAHQRVWSMLASAGIDFGAIRPMTEEGRAKVESAFAAILPKQAVALVCWRLAMNHEDDTVRQRDPTERLWIDDLAKARGLMHDAGWPHAVIDRIILPGQPRNLLGRREAAAMDDAACQADQWWVKWLYDNEAYAARKAVQTVIAESPAP